MSHDPKKALQRKTLRRVLSYIRPQAPLLLLSLLLSLLTVGFSLLLPILIGRGIDCIVGPGQVDGPRLLRLLAMVLFSVGTSALCQWLSGVLSNRLAYGTVRSVRRDAFAHIQQLPLSYLDAHPAGDTVSRMISDVDTFSDGLLLGFTQLFTGVITILGTLAFMLTLSPWITLAVVVMTPRSLFAAFSTVTRRAIFRLPSTIS